MQSLPKTRGVVTLAPEAAAALAGAALRARAGCVAVRPSEPCASVRAQAGHSAPDPRVPVCLRERNPLFSYTPQTTYLQSFAGHIHLTRSVCYRKLHTQKMHLFHFMDCFLWFWRVQLIGHCLSDTSDPLDIAD